MVLMSKIESLWNLSPLEIVVSKKFDGFLPDISDILWLGDVCLLLRSTFQFPLFVSHRENTSSMYLFYSRGLILLLLITFVSTADIKMLAKETTWYSVFKIAAWEF